MAVTNLGGLSNEVGSTFREKKTRTDYVLQSVVSFAGIAGITAYMLGLYNGKLRQFKINSLFDLEANFHHIKTNPANLTPEQILQKTREALESQFKQYQGVLNELIADGSEEATSQNLLRDLFVMASDSEAPNFSEAIHSIATALIIPSPSVPSKASIKSVLNELNVDGQYTKEHIEIFTEELHTQIGIKARAASKTFQQPLDNLGLPNLFGTVIGEKGGLNENFRQFLAMGRAKPGEGLTPAGKAIRDLIVDPISLHGKIYGGPSGRYTGRTQEWVSAVMNPTVLDGGKRIQGNLAGAEGAPALLDLLGGAADPSYTRLKTSHRLIKEAGRLKEGKELSPWMIAMLNMAAAGDGPVGDIARVLTQKNRSVYAWAKPSYAKKTSAPRSKRNRYLPGIDPSELFNRIRNEGHTKRYKDDLIVMDTETFFTELIGANKFTHSVGGKEITARLDRVTRKILSDKIGPGQIIAMKGAELQATLKQLEDRGIVNVEEMLTNSTKHFQNMEAKTANAMVLSFAEHSTHQQIIQRKQIGLYKNSGKEPLPGKKENTFYAAHINENEVFLAKTPEEVEQYLNTLATPATKLAEGYRSLKEIRVAEGSDAKRIFERDAGKVVNLQDTLDKGAGAEVSNVASAIEIKRNPERDLRKLSQIAEAVAGDTFGNSSYISRAKLEKKVLAAREAGKQAGKLAFASMAPLDGSSKRVNTVLATDIGSSMEHQIDLAKRFLKEGGVYFDTEFSTDSKGVRTVTDIGGYEWGGTKTGELITKIKRYLNKPGTRSKSQDAKLAKAITKFSHTIDNRVLVSHTGVDLDVMLEVANELQSRGIDVSEALGILDFARNNHLDSGVLFQVAGETGSISMDNIATRAGRKYVHGAEEDSEVALTEIFKRVGAIQGRLDAGIHINHEKNAQVYFDPNPMSPSYGRAFTVHSIQEVEGGEKLIVELADHHPTEFWKNGNVRKYEPTGGRTSMEISPRAFRGILNRADGGLTKAQWEDTALDRQLRYVRQFNPLARTFREDAGYLPKGYKLEEMGAGASYIIAAARGYAIDHADALDEMLAKSGGDITSIAARAEAAHKVALNYFDVHIEHKLQLQGYQELIPFIKDQTAGQYSMMKTDDTYFKDMMGGAYSKVYHSPFGQKMSKVFEADDPIEAMHVLTLAYAKRATLLFSNPSNVLERSIANPRLSVGFGGNARTSINLDSDSIATNLREGIHSLASEVATYAARDTPDKRALEALYAAFNEVDPSAGKAKADRFLELIKGVKEKNKIENDLPAWKTLIQDYIHAPMAGDTKEIKAGLDTIIKSSAMKEAFLADFKEKGVDTKRLEDSMQGGFNIEEVTKTLYSMLQKEGRKASPVHKAFGAKVKYQNVAAWADVTEAEMKSDWEFGIDGLNKIRAQGQYEPEKIAKVIESIQENLTSWTWHESNPNKGDLGTSLMHLLGVVDSPEFLEASGQIKTAARQATEAVKQGGGTAVGKDLTLGTQQRAVNEAAQAVENTFGSTSREELHRLAMRASVNRATGPLLALGGIAALMASHTPKEPELKQGHLSEGMKNTVAKNSEIPGPADGQKVWYGETTPFMLNISFKGFVRDKEQHDMLLRETYDAISQRMEITNQDTYIQDQRQKNFSSHARDILRRAL